MPIFDNLTKAAKDFFIEDEGAEGAAAAPAPAAQPATPFAAAMVPGATMPGVAQPEQRHLDHIAGLLTSDGKDFGAYLKMVKSMASSGMSGPMLYQTAFNAFAALTGTNRPALLASAEALEQKLTADRALVQERHREKVGESPGAKAKPSALVQLLQQEAQLQAAVADLTKQLAEKSQQLLATQQQAQVERQKVQSALASYELANAAALADIHAHRQAAQSFLAK